MCFIYYQVFIPDGCAIQVTTPLIIKNILKRAVYRISKITTIEEYFYTVEMLTDLHRESKKIAQRKFMFIATHYLQEIMERAIEFSHYEENVRDINLMRTFLAIRLLYDAMRSVNVVLKVRTVPMLQMLNRFIMCHNLSETAIGSDVAPIALFFMKPIFGDVFSEFTERLAIMFGSSTEEKSAIWRVTHMVCVVIVYDVMCFQKLYIYEISVVFEYSCYFSTMISAVWTCLYSF